MEMWLLHCRWGRARGKCSPPDFCPEQLGCNRPRWLQKGTESFFNNDNSSTLGVNINSCECGGKRNCCNRVIWKHSSCNKVPGCSSYHPSFFFRLFFLILPSPESWCCKLNRNGPGGPAKVFWVEREVSPVLTVSQVEVIGRAGRPQPHGVHGVVHVSGDGRVVRHCQHHLQQWEKWGKTGLGVKDDPANWREQFTIAGKRTEEIPSKHSVLDLARFTKQAC